MVVGSCVVIRARTLGKLARSSAERVRVSSRCRSKLWYVLTELREWVFVEAIPYLFLNAIADDEECSAREPSRNGQE